MVRIRNERIEDHPHLRGLITEAFTREFGRSNEAALVDALRDVANPFISLVAEAEENNNVIVGHIVFTPVRVVGGDNEWSAMGLAPMAVTPERQGQGIGGALIRAGLERCRALGHDVVVVLGHADYYPRFGFHPAPPLGIRSEYDVPDDAFMVAELEPGALRGRTGTVKYLPPFAEV